MEGRLIHAKSFSSTVSRPAQRSHFLLSKAPSVSQVLSRLGGRAVWQASISFQTRPGALIAPIGIWFEVDNPQGFNVDAPTGDLLADDPTAHEITWIWDFGDPGTFAAPQNMPASWNNKNVEYGKKGYHVFETPGTYTVSVWGIDSEGTTGQQSVTFEVLDPDEEYPGGRTICLSTEDDFADAPSGATLVTSISAAQTAAQNLGQTCRILLRRGESFTGSFRYDDARPGGAYGGLWGDGWKTCLDTP